MLQKRRALCVVSRSQAVHAPAIHVGIRNRHASAPAIHVEMRNHVVVKGLKNARV